MKVFAAIAVGLMLVAGPAPTSDAQGPAYKKHVACSKNASAPASHSCKVGQPKYAFFKSTKADAVYKICVKFPNGQRLCATHQPAPKGKWHKNEITATKLGKHKVKWYVDGDLVGRWNFNVTN